jgi:uncharacterized protein (DUF1786 family)
LIAEIDDYKNVLSEIQHESSVADENAKKRIYTLQEEIKRLGSSINSFEIALIEERAAKDEIERNLNRFEEMVIEKDKHLVLHESMHTREITWRDARIEEQQKAINKLEIDMLNSSVALDK